MKLYFSSYHYYILYLFKVNYWCGEGAYITLISTHFTSFLFHLFLLCCLRNNSASISAAGKCFAQHGNSEVKILFVPHKQWPFATIRIQYGHTHGDTIFLPIPTVLLLAIVRAQHNGCLSIKFCQKIAVGKKRIKTLFWR